MSKIFPDEVMLLILEHFLYDPTIALGVKSFWTWPFYEKYDFWQGVESVRRLLSSKSNMDQTLRSTFLRVNTIPLTLCMYKWPPHHAFHYGHMVRLQGALAPWPAGWSRVSSLSLNVDREIESKRFLQECPNLARLQIYGLSSLYHPTENCLLFCNEWHQFKWPRRKLAGRDFMDLHANLKLKHIELMALPLSDDPCLTNVHRKDEWARFVEVLQGFASEILSGFTQRRGEGEVKIEVIT